MDEGVGGVSGRSLVGVSCMLARYEGSEPSSLTRSRMDHRMDRAVDDPGLEARVRIAKGYCGGHIADVMEIIMLTRRIYAEKT